MTSFVMGPASSLGQEKKMQKQRVFFFAARTDDSGSMLRMEDLRLMAADYVRRYGESCLNDPETPSFVRRLVGQEPTQGLPRAG
jgi:hypothetical protein